MKFRLIISKDTPGKIIATVRECSSLTDWIESLVLEHTGTDRIPAFIEDDRKMLVFSDIACITALEKETLPLTPLPGAAD